MSMRFLEQRRNFVQRERPLEGLSVLKMEHGESVETEHLRPLRPEMLSRSGPVSLGHE
jgi:hypothetical protein